ncbi:hypothetical protein ACFXDH_33455 [Streptomyces sp. NPDC059467]|uniref:hypothetical protein n=1 Tax=Streptomyces sp. NPDC059467 TaxID=3346844 RepID=UPI00369B85A1
MHVERGDFSCGAAGDLAAVDCTDGTLRHAAESSGCERPGGAVLPDAGLHRRHHRHLRHVLQRRATRLVIGIKRRTPVGKAILGSVSQRLLLLLLLQSPVPVLAVRVDDRGTPAPTATRR